MLGFCHRLLALVFALSILAALAPAAHAGPYEDALARFLTGDFDDTTMGINGVAVSGSPLAPAVLGALQDGRLMFSATAQKVYFQDSSDQLHDALTGQPVTAGAPADLAPVEINNRLRRVIEAALGALTLMVGDRDKRLEAAQAVFQSRDAAALPALDQAIAKEADARVKRALLEARAAVVLNQDDASDAEKIEAVGVIRARGDQDAVALLASMPADTSPAVKKAAADAVASMQSGLAMWSALQNAWYGLSLGSVLALAAIGLAITFGVMGVINMAHGEMVMLGAYTTFVVQELIRTRNPALFDYSLAIAIPLAFMVSGVVGILVERCIIRFLYGRPLEFAARHLGPVADPAAGGAHRLRRQQPRGRRAVVDERRLRGRAHDHHLQPAVDHRVHLPGLHRLLGLLRLTRLGLEMRAVTQNRQMAAAVGIRTGRIDALTFGLGSGIAGIAGVALSQIDNVSPNLGQSYIINSFMVVVFGGVGNLWGTLVGAFTLGIANKFLEPFAGAVLGKITILVLIILFIQKRPRGLFALKGRAVEA